MGLAKSWMLENGLSVKKMLECREHVRKDVETPREIWNMKEILFIPHNEQVTLTDAFSCTYCINAQKKTMVPIQWNA